MSNSNENSRMPLESPIDTFLNMGMFNAQIVSSDHGGDVEDLAQNLYDKRSDLISRSFNSKLSAIRSQNPFIEILPLPDTVITRVCAGGVGTALDFNIPSGCQFIRFKGNADYYISLNGNASVPVLADNTNNAGNSSMYKPEDVFFFVAEMNSVSVIAPAAAIVTMQCFMQL
jgi:hypothetical protein